ncbi:hypothetical protein P8C59_005296 [Phyllachora maydis]|uniref:ER membrane protein complex subunit 7 beta-sandwich domain-containing protein n=1 Tax=Phyllachora maydis TaxID=1825666 RepID=A0AAD9MBB5_9PEZI|nr:hypothetical protein P8C59_005296 [Phyllachora maydis]
MYLLGMLPLAILSGASLANALSPPTSSVTFQVQATAPLPNPFSLHPSTHATLSTLGRAHTAPLSTANAFVFRNITAGSYLVDVHCATHAFVPLRLDVFAPTAETPARAGGLAFRAWETYRGNDWDNKGQAVAFRHGVFEIGAAAPKNYFMEKSKFSVLSILRSPMILLGLVSMGIFFGMPYLVDNMDPETRAEFEDRQKSNPVNSIMGSATGQPGANPIGNFDIAAFLAGELAADLARATQFQNLQCITISSFLSRPSVQE